MRIESLNIEGFGHFADQSFGPFDKPMTVLLGYNEAGKSTLLEFIRTILFGFPERNRALHYPPLKGGRHGGRVTLRANDGICYQVERFEDARGQTLSITSSDGHQSTDRRLLDRLLADCRKPMFEAVFALGLADLQDLSRLNAIESSAQIYAAGMGAANLPKAIKRLETAQDGLFKRGGSNQIAARLMEKLEDNQLKLDAAANDAVRYAGLTKQRAELETRIKEVDDSVASIAADMAAITRLEQARDDWTTLREAETQLRDLPSQTDFPEDGLVHLDKLETTLGESEQARAEALAACEVSRERAGAPIPGASLLVERERIEEMRRQRGAFDASVGDLPKRRAELAVQEDDLRLAMAELGEDWSEQRVAEFDTTAVVREAVERWRRDLATAGNAVHEAAGARVHTAELRDEATTAEAQLRSALEGLPRPTLDAKACESARESLETCRARLADYQRVVDQRTNAEAISGRSVAPVVSPASHGMRRPAGALVIGGLLAIVAGAAMGGGALLAGVFVAIVLGATSWGLLLVGRRTSTRGEAGRHIPDDYLDSLCVEEQASLESLREAAKPFGTEIPTAADLEKLAANLGRAEQSLRDFAGARKQWQEAAERLQLTASRLSIADAALESAQSSASEIREEWSTWLTERDLPGTLEPVAVATLIERVQTVRAHIKAVNELRHRIDAIQKDIERYRSLVRPLALAHGIEANFNDDTELAAAADWLHRDLTAALLATTRREGELQGLKTAEASLANLDARLAATQEQLDRLLEAGRAATVEEFRKNARTHELRLQFAKARFEAESRLRKLAADDQQYAEFLATLANTDFESLATERGRLVALRNEAEARRGQLREQAGKAAGELERLADDARTSELRLEQGMLIEELREVAKRWATLTVARTLLDKAQRKFEEERQPEVLRNAEEFFRTVTGGRYQRLISPIGTRSITAYAADGSSKTAGQLSRGTEDQLYLALRFGLIREFGQRSAFLPVVVDDILVNFDPDRAQRAADAFAELSRTNQVLVFTSQPSTVEMFRNASLAVQVIDMAKKPQTVR